MERFWFGWVILVDRTSFCFPNLGGDFLGHSYYGGHAQWWPQHSLLLRIISVWGPFFSFFLFEALS